MSQDNRNIWEPSQNYIPGRPDTDYVPLSKAKSDSLDIDVRRILALWPFILLFGLLMVLLQKKKQKLSFMLC